MRGLLSTQRISTSVAIKPKRKGTFNGWGAWFEVVFPGETSDKDVVLSTAPEQLYVVPLNVVVTLVVEGLVKSAHAIVDDPLLCCAALSRAV
jgi:hypothetical protein